MKKILVSLPDGIVKILDSELIGKIGQTRSDTLRTIITNWLSEQGYLAKGGKHEEK
jgi:metal-responsive CopG/Arc/MetJ family transcriptional regulator